MMFSGPKVIVIDDKLKHMTGLQLALDELGYSNRAVHYADDRLPEIGRVPGLRILLVDKSMSSAGTLGGTGDKNDYNVIASVVSDIVCPNGGPYGLVLWTEKPENLDGLVEVIGRDPDLPKPSFYTALAKADYMDTATGEIRDADALRSSLKSLLSQSPQLHALLDWEQNVAKAQNAVLETLFAVTEDTSIETSQTELGKLLYRLSEADAGKRRGAESPRQSIQRVLSTMLLDRLEASPPDATSDEVWANAVVDPEEQALSVDKAARINTAIHYERIGEASPPSVAPSSGFLYHLPEGESIDSLCGLSQAELLEALDIKEDERAACELLLMRIGAVCDDAQPKAGPVQFVLTVRWPFTNDDGSRTGKKSLHKDRRPKAYGEWISPAFMVACNDAETAGCYSVLLGLSISLNPAEVASLKPAGRFRASLAEVVTRSYARHIGRPGILEL